MFLCLSPAAASGRRCAGNRRLPGQKQQEGSLPRRDVCDPQGWLLDVLPFVHGVARRYLSALGELRGE
jgi:hypothetical protein